MVWAATLADHVWKMAWYGAPADDIAPALDELFESKHACDELYQSEKGLYRCSGWLLARNIEQFEKASKWDNENEEEKNNNFAILLENPACRAVIDKWKKIAET